MKEELRSWLNDPSDYQKGVALYQELGSNEYFKKLSAKREDQFNRQRLKELLSDIYDDWDNVQDDSETEVPNLSPGGIIKGAAPLPINSRIDTKSNEKELDELLQSDTSTKLIAACKLSADKSYKQQMNTRAILFKLCSIEHDKRENYKNKVDARYPIVQELLEHVKATDKLYADYHYAKENGCLPNTPKVVPEQLSPVELVNRKNNLMKNISYHRRHKDQTPNRLNTIQRKEAELKKVNDELDRLAGSK